MYFMHNQIIDSNIFRKARELIAFKKNQLFPSRLKSKFRSTKMTDILERRFESNVKTWRGKRGCLLRSATPCEQMQERESTRKFLFDLLEMKVYRKLISKRFAKCSEVCKLEGWIREARGNVLWFYTHTHAHRCNLHRWSTGDSCQGKFGL